MPVVARCLLHVAFPASNGASSFLPAVCICCGTLCCAAATIRAQLDGKFRSESLELEHAFMRRIQRTPVGAIRRARSAPAPSRSRPPAPHVRSRSRRMLIDRQRQMRRCGWLPRTRAYMRSGEAIQRRSLARRLCTVQSSARGP